MFQKSTKTSTSTRLKYLHDDICACDVLLEQDVNCVSFIEMLKLLVLATFASTVLAQSSTAGAAAPGPSLAPLPQCAVSLTSMDVIQTLTRKSKYVWEMLWHRRGSARVSMPGVCARI